MAWRDKKLFNQSLKQSWKDYKDALHNLTPLDHAIAKRTFHLWAAFGAACASSGLFIQGFQQLTMITKMSTLGFGILVGAIGGLQYVEWRKENQKIYGIKKLEESYNGIVRN